MISRGENWGNTGLGLYEYEPLKPFPYDPLTGTTKTTFTSTPTIYTKIATPQMQAAQYDIIAGKPTRKLTVDEYAYYYALLKNQTDLPLYAKVALAECLLIDLAKVYPLEPHRQRDKFLDELAAQKSTLEDTKPFSPYHQEKAKFINMIQSTYDDPTQLTSSESQATKNVAIFGNAIETIADIRAKRAKAEAEKEASRIAAEEEKLKEEDLARQQKWVTDGEIRFSEYVKKNIESYMSAILKTSVLAPYMTYEHELVNNDVVKLIAQKVRSGELLPDEGLKTYAQAVANFMRPLPKEVLLEGERLKLVYKFLTEKLEPYQLELGNQVG